MARHYVGKSIQFEEKIRMAGGDHFVIHGLFVAAQVARKAFLTALGQIARVVHSQRKRFLMCPIALRVRAQPSGCRSMATLAANPLAQLERAAAFALRHIERVACKTSGRGFRGTYAKNLGHSLPNWAGQSCVCFRVFVLYDPDAVLILQHPIIASRNDASVAGRRRAGTGSRVLASCVVRLRCRGRRISAVLRKGIQRKNRSENSNDREEN